MAFPNLFRLKKIDAATAWGDHPRMGALVPPTATKKAPGGGKGSSQLDVPLPKAGKPGGMSFPSLMTSAKPNPTSAFNIPDNSYAGTDLLTLRTTAQNTRDLISKLVTASPEVAGAVNAYARVGIPANFTAVAYNMDGTFNRDATALVQAIMARIDYLGNADGKSFDDSQSIRSLAESLNRDLRVYGAAALELVLDKARMPAKLQGISFSQIKMYPTADGKAVTPKQIVAGQIIDLDFPTVFIVGLDQNFLSAYPDSPLEPALQGVMFSFEFMNDIRRVLKRAIHPRYNVEIDEEKFMDNMPPEYKGDTEKIRLYTDAVVTALQTTMQGLNPEDALVHFSSIGIDVIDHGNTNLANEYSTIDGMVKAKLTTGTKMLPSVLGIGDSTANVASSETLMFMKNVESATTFKLNEIISQALTQAARLMGQDVYVKFEFERIDLRPDLEIESFRALKQSRVLTLLSLGMMEDDEACITLTGHMTPVGYEPKSGTGFMPATAPQPADNGTNGTSNDGSALNKSLKPQTPTGGARGQNKRTPAKTP